MEHNKKFRAVSNLDADGCNPAYNQGRSRRATAGQADVKYFDTIGDGTRWLLRTGGGGIIYHDADDSVVGVVKPQQREYRAVTTDARDEFFASAKAAREWLRSQRCGGWVEQYDPMIAKFTPREKLEAV